MIHIQTTRPTNVCQLHTAPVQNAVLNEQNTGTQLTVSGEELDPSPHGVYPR